MNKILTDQYIIGINWEQNSSVALFQGGQCLSALSNERLTRRKNDEGYPKEAIDALLDQHSLKKADIKCVVFSKYTMVPGMDTVEALYKF